MGTTSVSPSELYWDSESLHIRKETGTIEGDITGSIGIEHVNLIDQSWGIWWASSVGYIQKTTINIMDSLISIENFEEGYIRGAQ